MSVITPQPILMHLRDRLRANYVDSSLYDDGDLLSLLSDAYIEACERAAVLEQLATITVTPLTATEYALPADHSQTQLVYLDGVALDQASLQASIGPITADAYYEYATTIGFTLVNTTDARTARLLYCARPAAFATWADDLDPRFPIEFADMLVHHVRWRVQMLSGGAERIGQALGDRDVFQTRVGELRQQMVMLDQAGSWDFQSGREDTVPATNDLRMIRAR
jgi:hypothetical protein